MLPISFNEWDKTQPLKRVALADGLPKSELKDCRLSECLLDNKHLKDVSFLGGIIKHCRFVDCKLTNAVFERVDLTDTAFRDCDLRKATFSCCTMWYVTFQRCELNYESVIASAPKEDNLRLAYYRRLRVNASEMGEKEWADRLLVLELATRQRELISIALGASGYYRNRYARVQRSKAALDILVQMFNRFWWGFGLRLSSLARSAAIVLVAFAAIYRLTPVRFLIDGRVGPATLTWPHSLYYSITSLTTVGASDIRPFNTGARIATSVESLVGVLFLGFFAAAMYRRLAK